MKKILLLSTMVLAVILAKAQDNNALQITPGSSYFWCPTFMDFKTSSVTFEAWIKIDSDAAVNDYTAVVDGRYGPKTSSKSLIFKTINNKLTLSYEWEGAWDFEDTEGLNEVQKGEWQHVALVVDETSKTATFYVNGEEGAIHQPTGTDPKAYGNLGAELYWDTLFIGSGNTDPNRTVIGLIDEIRVWNVARTQEEIEENMTAEISDVNSSILLAYYRCNEEAGDSILIDDSGNGNDGLQFGDGANLTFVADDDWMEDSKVSLHENYLENITVYPNPVKNILHFKGMDLINAEIKIFDLLGQLVEKSIIYNSSVNVSGLISGVYIVEINTNNRKFHTNIMKE